MNQKKKLSRKVISYVLALVMVFSILTGIVPGMGITAQAAEATTLTAETTTWVNGDYVVPAGGVTISGHITVKGIVNLTLTEGATLTANMGITLGQNARLNVSGKGAMVVNGSNGNTNSTVAGTGKLVLKSGTLTATGGNGQSFSSGNETTGNTGGVAINGTVAVNGGTLAATGGNGGSLNAHTISELKGGTGGAAIGGAVTINGGTVTATGGNGGSITITNYGDSNKGGNGGAAIGGAVTINGGTLTATKGDNGTLNIKNGSPNYAGTGSAGYDGTLTLGANVKLYEGTDNTGTVLDDNDSDSRVYSGEKKANMYAYGSDVDAVADKSELNDAITVAEKWYGRIKNNTDYIDIASALKTAIDTAKAVADNDEAGQDVVDTATQNLITAILSAEASISMGTTWEEETYVVPIFGETIAGHITVTGTVNLILTKGATLTANAGITLNDGATLNVSGDGAMVINGTSGNTNSTVAGSGVLVLKSGTLTATGGTGGSVGTEQMNATANAGGAAINGAVTVKGGTLTATGGTGGSIGNYSISCTSGAGGAAINGAVTVNGGTLTATDGTKGTSGNAHKPTLGAGGAGYSGTLTLGKGVKLYEGTEANEEKLLDGNDSASHVYEGEKKAKMFAIAEGPDKTALDDAITAAVTLYDSIKNNNDYIDIASTLKTAIDAAKGVAESDEADQDGIDAAKTAITTAKTTAETAKKNIDDTKAANAVIEKINALPLAGDVTASDKSAIEEAREAYDKLTDDQKEIVNKDASILLYLQAAEEALAALPEILDSTSTTWNKNATITDNLITIDDKVTVTADITLTIPEGKTLTVNGGIDAGEYTVTVAGKGMLVVTGTNGTEGTNGTSNGGAGSDGFKGNIIVDGATVTVTGGNGGNVTGSYVISGSNGGNGGNGVAGNITVNSGSATVTGGNGGTGGSGRHSGSSGSTGIAVTGTITGPTVEESADNSTWTKIESGASSTKKYIKVSEATAEVVKSKIDALPNADEVTIEDKTDIQKARDAYNALDDTEKGKITEDTLKKLTDAEDALAAAEASNVINALPSAADITIANKEAVEAARKAYDDLTDAQEAYVSADTLKKLTDAEDALAAAEASNVINALPSAADITIANKEAVEAARKAYDDLTDAQEAYVSADTLKKLTDAEDALAAAEASNVINALPSAADITIANKEAVEAARKAYDDLTDAQEAYVSTDTLKKLTDAEEALKELTDKAAADSVTDTINKLPASDKVATTDKAAIEAARKAYDALTADQKAKVTPETLKNLEAAEKALAAAEKKETDDTDAAKKVTDAINALPASDKVATTDKATIEAARKAYDALTAEQKAKVTPDTLKKLEAAEKALATAEKKETDDTDAAKKVNDAIGKLPASDKVATTDKAAIEAARKAYDALTADQKKKVSADTLKKLTDAEAALKTATAKDKAAKELAAAKEEAQASMNEQVTVTQKGSKFTVKWKKSSAADGYYVYAQYCGKKITKPAKTIAKNTTIKTTITKINGKKINQKRQFRVYVVPYKIIDGKKVALGKSTVAHLVGAKSTKYSNVKKLTLTKKKYTVKVGKTAKIKAKVTLVNKNKKHIPKSHGAKFRYKSSDTSIATVDKNGKIKGIKKGTCTIYVYSINGLMKKAKVTIK